MKRFALAAFAALLCVSASARDYSLVGSRTMYPLNLDLVQAYHAAHPDVTITVSDAGTGKGIESAISGKTDVAAITRSLRPEEMQALRQQTSGDGVMVPLGREGIAVYVNQQNPVSDLTPQEIAAIYSGKITNWRAVGGPNLPIRVYSFDNSTGRYWYLVDEVMRNAPLSPAVRYTDAGAGKTDASSLRAKEEQMQLFIWGDPCAIGFGDLKRLNRVKMVAIINKGAAYLPTPSNVATGLYPLTRTLSFFFRRPPGGDMLAFAQWAAAQRAIIAAHGFTPLQ
jgi:phosphate transport system substrate-binding protein